MTFKITLNPRLIAKQGLTADEVARLEELHKVRHGVIQRMKRSKKPETLRKLAAEVTEIDFKLQAVWKFPLDANFHRFWELPHCSCPYLDNLDDYPYRQHYSKECLIHGLCVILEGM